MKAAEPSRVKFLPGITGRTARVFKYQAELQVQGSKFAVYLTLFQYLVTFGYFCFVEGAECNLCGAKGWC